MLVNVVTVVCSACTPPYADPHPDAAPRPDGSRPPPDRLKLDHGLRLSPVFAEVGPADPSEGIRALISLPIRDEAVLDATIEALYAPGNPSYRAYLDRETWIARHAPLASDVDAVRSWLACCGLEVARVATNRLLIQVVGTVGAFEATFGTKLARYAKIDEPDHVTFGVGPEDFVWAPFAIAPKIGALVTADPPAAAGPLPPEAGEVDPTPPPSGALTLAPLARVYGLSLLAEQGHIGEGVTIGVIAGAGFKKLDVQSFWQAQGVTRSDAEVVTTMEPLATRYTETTLDVEWSGGLAPGAALVVYAGPDARDTSLLYTFNAAVADGRAHILTDSFAHREDATSRTVRHQYDVAAKMAATLGMTIVAAGGDTAEPDIPSASPYVTSVGGTVLELSPAGERSRERAWSGSGSGESLMFDRPPWQHAESPKRAVSDVALSAGNGHWVYAFGEWKAYRGTSFSAPVFAAVLAAVNSARRAAGKPMTGFLNSTLYGDAAVQRAFFDVTIGATAFHAAAPGWDYPTGWGAPDAVALAEALP